MEVGRRIAGIVVIVCISISLNAQNLLVNGSFDDNGGSFDGWTVSHDGQPPYYSPAISTNGVEAFYARFLFEPYSGDALSQTIATVPGVTYDISFYAEDGDGHNFGAQFSFGDFTTNIMLTFEDGPGTITPGWLSFDFSVPASAEQTDVSFLINADTGSEFGVDKVSVTPVPEPATMALVILGIAASAGAGLHRSIHSKRNSTG